jgi:hypothetical protein
MLMQDESYRITGTRSAESGIQTVLCHTRGNVEHQNPRMTSIIRDLFAFRFPLKQSINTLLLSVVPRWRPVALMRTRMKLVSLLH